MNTGNTPQPNDRVGNNAVWFAGTGQEFPNQYAFAVRKSDGSVVTWGVDIYGGDSSSVAGAIASGVEQIYSNRYAFAALKSDGSVVAWGGGGQYSGPIGNGMYGSAASNGGNTQAVADKLTSGVTDIFSTAGAFAALKADGSVVTWGPDKYGGDSTKVADGLAGGVTQIFSNEYSFAALKQDGSVVTWGYRGLGMGGDSSAVADKLRSGVVEVFSTSGAFAALKEDGSLVVWGDRDLGGNASSVLSRLGDGVVRVYSNERAFAAVKSDGSVVAWGDPSFGGSTTGISGLSSGVQQITASRKAFAALKNDGSVVTWGNAVGGGNSEQVAAQLQSGVKDVFANSFAFAALKTDGTVVTWGSAENGGSTADASGTLSGVVQIVSNWFAFGALKATGELVVWGDPKTGGSPGIWQPFLSSGVVQVGATAQAFAALRGDGTVVTWGNPEWGAGISLSTLLSLRNVIEIASPLGLVQDPSRLPPDAPRISLSSNLTQFGADSAATIRFFLTQASTDFSLQDVYVTGGTLKDFSGSGKEYSATFTPNAGTTSSALIQVPSGSFRNGQGIYNQDGADGNNSIRLGVDTVLPAISSVAPGTGANAVQRNTTITLAFSEPVVAGTGSVQLLDAAGKILQTIVASDTSKVSATGSVVTIQLAASLPVSATITLVVDPKAFVDKAGNPSSGISASQRHTFTTETVADDYAQDRTTTGVLEVNGSAVSGSVDFGADVDAVAVALVVGQTVTFRANSAATGGLADPQLKIYGPDFALLRADEDSGGGRNAQIVLTPTVAGTYFAVVSDSFGGTGQYTLTATSPTQVQKTASESEDNGSRATATALADSVLMTGNLRTKEDADYYLYQYGAAGTLSISFDAPTNSPLEYFRITTYNSAGVLQTSQMTGSDRTYTMSVSGAGQLYVAVDCPYDPLSFRTYYDSRPYTVKFVLDRGIVTNETQETESNGTTQNANNLVLGVPMIAQLSTSSDVDVFSYTANATGVSKLKLDVPTESSADFFRVTVTDAAGGVLARYLTGSDKEWQVATQSSARYYVSIDTPGYFYSSGAYALTVSQIAGGTGAESEPNDVDPNALLAATPVRGQLSSRSDVDRFVLNTTQAGDLKIDFDAPDRVSADAFRITVISESGAILASRFAAADFSMTVSAAQPGRYVAVVSNGDPLTYSAAEYGLTMSLTSVKVARESEVNDTRELANGTNLGQSIYGQLSSSRDIDFFKVSLGDPGALRVLFDAPTNSVWENYFTVSLYNDKGTLIDSRSSGGDTAFEAAAQPAGTYYVEVAVDSSRNYSSGEYALTVETLTLDSIPDDAIRGTPYADTLVGNARNNPIYGLGGNDLIDGGGGTDTAVFRASLSSFAVTTISGITAVRGNYAAGDHALTTSRLWNVEKLKTYSGTIDLEAPAVSPTLGTPGDDQITGTLSDDLFDGLGGTDFIDGKAGRDTLVVFAPRANLEVDTLEGITRIRGKDDAQEYAGKPSRVINVEVLGLAVGTTVSIEAVERNWRIGTPGTDLLLGTSLDEVFDGRGGMDTVDGGAGKDSAVFFGRLEDFAVALPTAGNPTTTVVGKKGEYAGHTAILRNIELLVFGDQTLKLDAIPGLVINQERESLSEGGGPITLGVSLASAPAADVSIKLSAGNQLRVDQPQLTFTAANWNKEQTVAVQAIDDALVEGQHAGILSVDAFSSDKNYVGLKPTNVTFKIADNDVPATGSVIGSVWNDANRNGRLDSAEGKLAGWRVFDDVNRNGKFDSNEVSTLTDARGFYQLSGLIPGKHLIGIERPAGWGITYPTAPTSAQATLLQPAPISDTVSSGEPVASAAAWPNADFKNLGLATAIADLRNDPRYSGFEGQGLAVVVIDSGIDLDHPYFGPDSNKDGVADRIIYQYDFTGRNDADGSDVQGHGTHVASIIGSSDSKYVGIAPQVNIISLRVLGDNGSGSASDILEALYWTVLNAKRYNIVAVNMSLGDSSFDTSPTAGYMHKYFQALTSLGVIVVAAAGNSYHLEQRQGVAYPASDPLALAVGAVWAQDGKTSLQVGVPDAIAGFSQRAELTLDVFAPGVNINAAKIGGSFVSKYGTSMAAPEVTGIIALLQQIALRDLGRTLSFEEMRDLLVSTGDPVRDGDDENDTVFNTGLTWPRVNVVKAAERIAELVPPASQEVVVEAAKVKVNIDFGFAALGVVQGSSADDVIVTSALGDVAWGGSGKDQILGAEGADRLGGEDGDDRLIANAGDDWITGGAGNDELNGGDGTDIAVQQGNLKDYRIVLSSGNGTVTDSVVGRDGADVLSGIEHIRFSDFDINTGVKAVASSVSTASLERVIELYVAFFNRTPDADGLSYWLGQTKAGMSTNTIAEAFYGAGVQYSSLTGFSASMSNADFVNVVYKNVLGRADGADADGLAYWTGELASGRATRGTLVSTMLDSAHTFKGDATWGWVANLLDNKIVVAKQVAVEWGLNYLTPDASVSNGMAIAKAVTPTDTAAAIALVGIPTDAILLG